MARDDYFCHQYLQVSGLCVSVFFVKAEDVLISIFLNHNVSTSGFQQLKRTEQIKLVSALPALKRPKPRCSLAQREVCGPLVRERTLPSGQAEVGSTAVNSDGR